MVHLKHGKETSRWTADGKHAADSWEGSLSEGNDRQEMTRNEGRPTTSGPVACGSLLQVPGR